MSGSITSSTWSPEMGGGGDTGWRKNFSFICPPGSFIKEVGYVTTGRNWSGQPFIGELHPVCTSGEAIKTNTVGSSTTVNRQENSEKKIFDASAGISGITWNGGATLEGLQLRTTDGKSSELIGANTGSTVGNYSCPANQVVVGLKGVDSAYYNTFGTVAQLQAVCDYPVNCLDIPNVLANPACREWCMNNPTLCNSQANQYCSSGTNVATDECLQWFKKTNENNSRLSDNLVKMYCDAHPNNMDLCGCYNWKNKPEYAALQKKLTESGQTLIPECHLAECAANPNAYKSTSAKSTRCPDQMLCLQGIDVGSANTSSMQNITLNCNQTSSTTTGSGNETPLPSSSTSDSNDDDTFFTTATSTFPNSTGITTFIVIFLALILIGVSSLSAFFALR
jgi:hypothetical protein